MFLRQMTDAFLVRTEPASSIVKPAHIHMISAPQTRNAKVFRTKSVFMNQNSAERLRTTRASQEPAQSGASVS